MALDKCHEWLWRAWMALSGCRPRFGMAGAPGTIPWTATRAWCLDHGITGPDRDLLEAAITMLDSCYFASWAARQPKA